MKKIMVCLTGVVAVLFMAAMPCLAAPAGSESTVAAGKKDWAEQREKMDKGLGLTPEQQAKMKAFHEENRAKMEALRTKMKADRTALREALDADVFDKGRVEALSAEVNASFAAMAERRIQMAVFARETLTPEQFKKMKVMREQHRKAMGAGHGERMGGHNKGADKDNDEPSMGHDGDGPGM